MKILIDSSLIREEEWFESFPVFINNVEDTNNKEHIVEILSKKNNTTAYLSFGKLKQKYLLDEDEEAVIFTIPKSMSGQWNTYNNQNKRKNVLILEGTSLFTNKEDVKRILERQIPLKEIEKEIKKLNMQVKMSGVVLNARTLNLKGRIHTLFAMLIKTAKVKIRMEWKQGEWIKDKVSLNGTVLIKKLIVNKKQVNLICSDISNSKANKVISKLAKEYPDIVFKKQFMTNSMLAHSGQDFVVIY
ncbi:DegV family protein [Mycoplasma todarodis]|uniref:DegV family protein n=1 Tax=Mycoplasma todarodis TaxID=1937191 RepID=UPI003B2B0B26